MDQVVGEVLDFVKGWDLGLKGSVEADAVQLVNLVDVLVLPSLNVLSVDIKLTDICS